MHEPIVTKNKNTVTTYTSKIFSDKLKHDLIDPFSMTYQPIVNYLKTKNILDSEICVCFRLR